MGTPRNVLALFSRAAPAEGSTLESNGTRLMQDSVVYGFRMVDSPEQLTVQLPDADVSASNAFEPAGYDGAEAIAEAVEERVAREVDIQDDFSTNPISTLDDDVSPYTPPLSFYQDQLLRASRREREDALDGTTAFDGWRSGGLQREGSDPWVVRGLSEASSWASLDADGDPIVLGRGRGGAVGSTIERREEEGVIWGGQGLVFDR